MPPMPPMPPMPHPARPWRRAVAALPLLALWLGPPDVAAEPVDLELVLAIDASASVSREEFFLQVHGLAEAFRGPAVAGAIESLAPDGVAIAVVQWSSPGQRRLALDWSAIRDAAGALAFAARLDTMPRYFVAGATAIGSAIEFATLLFAESPFAGRRRTIDVSGDGPSNEGVLTVLARDRAGSAGITINGLAILNEEPELDAYYLATVIAGADAFVMSAANYEDFAEAIRIKLVREIGGLSLVSLPAAWRLSARRVDANVRGLAFDK